MSDTLPKKISHTDFQDFSYQASAFTPGLQFTINRILGSLLSKYSDRFDGEPISLPLPEEMPMEAPRIILRSVGEIWKLQISPLRIDFFWKGGIKDEKNSNKSEFIGLAEEVLDYYQDISKVVYGRLALVVERIAFIDKPGISLAWHFCKEERTNTVLNRPDYFEIHAHKRYKVNDEFPDINSWIRHKVVILKSGEHKGERVILVEQDLNTPPENINDVDFNKEMRHHFFKVIPIEMYSILKKYYPDVS
jgi:hypothetical protein